jgi:hypothetical protein
VIRSGADCRCTATAPRRADAETPSRDPSHRVTLSSPFARAIAQSKPTVVVNNVTQENPLIDDVARNDPDGPRGLLQRLEILTTGRRDSGPTRSGSTPTAQESAQCAANPLLSEAYTRDRAATLARLRATNEELDRARHREPLGQQRREYSIGAQSGAGIDTISAKRGRPKLGM